MLTSLRNYLFKKDYLRVVHREHLLAERESAMQMEVNRRVADFLTHFDPFEPLLRKYNVIFSKEYTHPEDTLDEQSQLRLFQWAYGVTRDAEFNYLIDWIRNTQGNATLRKSQTEAQWLYGRAAVTTMTLFADEVSRCASRYQDILAKQRGETFDNALPVE